MGERPRNYGEPTDKGYEKAQDALSDWIAFSRTARAKQWLETQAIGFAQESVRELGLSYEEVYERQKNSYQIAALDLPRSEPFWVSSEIVQILQAARHKLPAVELRPSDLLVPHGFVALEEPIPDFWCEEGFEPLPLWAFAWTTFEGPSGSKYALATAFTDVPAVSEVTFPGSGEMIDYEFPIARLLIVFWLLAKQRLLTQSREQPSRAVRRRAKAQEIKTVTVVRLRKRVYADTEGSRKVDWTHRWLVRGFYRNQWYPSEQRHRPLWIADFVKGPSNKPFVAKQRVFEFVR